MRAKSFSREKIFEPRVDHFSREKIFEPRVDHFSREKIFAPLAEDFSREKIFEPRAKKISCHSVSDSFFYRKILVQFNVSLQDETDHSAILDLVKRIRFDAEIFHVSTERNLNQFAGVSRCLFAQGD